jgi:multiple sugar transport system substrate-binding protein
VKKTLFAVFAVLALTAVLIFTGCNKPLGGTNKIRFMYWGDVSEIEIINQAVADFEKATGVKVSAERAPSGPPYMEKVLTQFAGGSAPDVLFVEANNFKKFADKDVLEDLTPYLDKETAFKKSDFYPQIIDRFTVDNKLFVLPRDIAPICCVYYNKNLFDEASVKYPTDDWSWKDLLSKGLKLVKKDAQGRIVQYGYVDDWPIWETFVLSNGGSLVDNEKNPKKCTLDKKAAYEGVQFRSDLIHKYMIMPSPSQMTAMGGMGSGDMFVSGRAAMFYSGIWKSPSFRQIKDFKWDVVMFPKGPTGIRAFPTGGSGYAIVKSSKNKEAAWKLVTYLAGEKGQKLLAETGLAQPAMVKIAESPAFLDGKDPQNKKIVLAGVKYIKFMPLMAEWEEINVSMIAPNFDKIWSGKETAKAVLQQIVPQINESYFTAE